MEIWNNVFSQFNNMGDGTYEELAQKNIDTGMGLERLACVMQGVDNMFEVDTIRKIIDKVCEISGKTYGADKDNDISIRVITDHTRSAMFMIADGVIPSNEGRGYVLRRIIRRACRHGKLLGINHAFLVDMVTVAIGESCDAYPELSARADYIKKVLSMEEERFDATIDAGLSILSDLIRGAVEKNADTISGEEVFKLYDTFGFPIDLTREIAEESNLKLDEETFAALMKDQKKRAREARANISGWSESSASLLSDLPATEFTGYTEFRSPAKILAIIAEDALVESVSEGDCTVVLDKTSFYGEGGGQIGDTGTIYADGSLLNVYDTKKKDGVYLHMCTVVNGEFKVGDAVMSDIDDMRRKSIARNHSACHLLQAALRTVLGDHVEQAGSYVSNEVCRFDFTHFAALTETELQKVEALVNLHILAANEIVTKETDIETARAEGAMALFGEKYGAVVRMVKMGDFSCELCGGTHLDNTAKAGLFKILTETSVAAGVRRIEGTTGLGVLRELADKNALLHATAQELKAQNVLDLPKRATSLQGDLRAAKQEIESLQAKIAAAQAGALTDGAIEVGGITVITKKTQGMPLDMARTTCDQLKDKIDCLVVVLSTENDGRYNFVCACSKYAVAKGAHAGNLLKTISAIAGGNGGGRPDSATSGAKDPPKIDDALAAVADVLAGMLK
jgi:alanyl-tRNA synthetase